jgi:hypothetical protein
MAYSPDFTHDLELAVYGLESMTLKVEGQADIMLDNCVGDEPFQVQEMEPSDGQVPQIDNRFVWPVYHSPVQPPLGSVLVSADDTYYTILAIEHRHIVDTWRAHCRNLSIIPGTINTATVLKAHFGKGRANEAKPEWRGLVSGKHHPTNADEITARFQPSTEDAVLRFDAEWMKQSVRIILDKPLPLDLANGEYRIVTETSERYRILRYFDAQRIDKLPVIFAVKILEGSEYFQPSGVPDPLPPPTFPKQ